MLQLANAPKIESIQGTVERVTFFSEETGFSVLRVHVKGHKDLVTVIGHTPSLSVGEHIECDGEWFHDRRFGMQFKASQIRAHIPTSKEGIEKYLASGLIKGIGAVHAKKLVDAFGDKVLDIIENHPEQLKKVKGIGKYRIGMILEGWAEQKSIRDIMLFLHEHNISAARAVRIFKTYGDLAVVKISENPYRLARDIHGIGFLTADNIAQSLGIAKDSPLRAQAGLTHALITLTDSGHCGYPMHDLIELTQTLLSVPADVINDALQMAIAQDHLIYEEFDGMPFVFLPRLFHSELTIAKHLKALLKEPVPWEKADFEGAIDWVERQNDITLSKSQREAIDKALTSKVLIITGGPGVGKTTLINSILQILGEKKQEIILCAPTGRAAKRMTESTGVEAKTIHRLLGMGPHGGAMKDEHDQLDCDLLVVDEASMVDVNLMAALLQAIPKSSALIVVGDIDQLPSVGPGQVLCDMIQSDALPTIYLTEIFRQAKTSKIIRSAHQINKGEMPEIKTLNEETDFYFLETETPENAAAKIIALVKERIPQKFKFSSTGDIQVLCPMNKGIVGTRTLNVELQRELNPPTQESIQRFGYTFSVGDKVMQITNNYDKDVYNGDIGFVKYIDKEETKLVITYEGREVNYDFSELDEVVLAYATTIHKAQGSEYPAVVIPIMTQHYTMLQRNLIYTGITRGKQLVVLVGQEKALAMAVAKTSAHARWTFLKDRLKNR